MRNYNSPALLTTNKFLQFYAYVDKFDIVRKFANSNYSIRLLLILMNTYYLNRDSTSKTDYVHTKETLYSLLYKKISRLSLSTFIDKMTEDGVLEKKFCTNDRRKYEIFPSKILVNEFETMNNQLNEEFNFNEEINSSAKDQYLEQRR